MQFTREALDDGTLRTDYKARHASRNRGPAAIQKRRSERRSDHRIVPRGLKCVQSLFPPPIRYAERIRFEIRTQTRTKKATPRPASRGEERRRIRPLAAEANQRGR
ncbi:hypothetical protein P7K49_023044 [Saguinus oedipus]|uniref:Uncharacterized protein n=1 Tax=Saguinus oedipus TaxID=9490 RepID=A0ABQ9UKJ0_SAGOE|nr:hypothetical protein P7K49_023044 [Saguinus oedipus]